MRRTIEASAHDSRAIDLQEAPELASRPDGRPAGRGPATNGAAGSRAGNPRGERRRAWARRFVLPLAVAAVALGAALWPRAPFALDVGAPGDRLFLGGVHGDERTAEHSYRWTGKGPGDAEVSVPGWGAVRRVRAEVTAQALPERAPVTVELRANGVLVGTLVVDGAMATRVAEFELPGGGVELRLALRSPLNEVPGDSRSLGVKLDAVRLTPLAWDAGAYLRTLWPALGAGLLFAALALALVWPLPGPAGWVLRGAAALAAPLAAALALPWTLRLLPFASLALGAGLAARHRRRLGASLLDAWAALDRPAVARWVAGAGIALYLAVLLWHVPRVPWINHADYADNAVVARNLVQGRGFSVDYVAQFYRDYATVRHPADTWPPLQPLLIAPFFALFGVSTAVAKLPNVLIMAGLLFAVYRAGAALWSPCVGLIAALFVALHDKLFEGAVYPLNDVVFTLLAFFCLLLLGRLSLAADSDRNGAPPPGPPILGGASRPRGIASWGRRGVGVGSLPPGLGGRGGAPSALAWPLLGLLAGLLYLAKPSGLLLLAGAATWALWSAWSAGRLRPLLANGAVAAGVALLTAAPWLVRNLVTFGRPFYSTEQYDAWVLKYRPWEEIYRVYAGRLPLPHPRLLVGYGLDRVLEAIGSQVRQLWDDLSGGKIVPVTLLPLIVLGACLANGRERRVQLAILAAATAPYWLFLLVYWHYEPRYALYLVPWAALLGAAGLGWLHDQLAATRGRGLAAVAAVVALVVLLAPQVGVLRETMASDRRVPSSVAVAEWLRDNTPADAVVMSRDPWELAFHSERQTVMIPYDDLPTIEEVARRYGVTYLHLSHLEDQARPALAPLYEGREVGGFRKVYDSRDQGGSVLVYRFPDIGR